MINNSGWSFFLLFQYYAKDNDIIYDLLIEEIEKIPSLSNIDFYIFKLSEDKKICFFKTINTGVYLRFEQVGEEIEVNDFFRYPFTSAQNIWESFFKMKPVNDHKRNFISIHSHGAGFGFTPKIIGNFKSPKSRKHNFWEFFTKQKIRENDEQHLLMVKALFSNGVFTIDSFTDYKNKHNFNSLELNIIPVSVFNKVLKKILLTSPDQKIDFLCLANCFMQCAETGYLLKDTVKYLVASEGTHLSSGINYPKLYEQISNEASTSEMIATNICNYLDERLNHEKIIQYFQRFAGDPVADINNVRTYYSVSINDLSRYEELKNKLSKLSEALLDLIKTNKAVLNELVKIRQFKDNLKREKCYDVFYSNPIGIIDLCNFLYEVILNKNLALQLSPDIKKSIFELINLIKQYTVVTSHFPGGAFYRDMPVGICPSGISIFLPRTKKENRRNPFSIFLFENFYSNSQNLPEFLKNNKWREFVIEFYTSSENSFR